jgi:hypothetical protein
MISIGFAETSALARAAMSVGTIFVHEIDGGSLRRHVGKADRKPNGLFSSTKARRSMVFEAMHQRDQLWIWEADAKIVDFVSEPLRVELMTTHGPMVYFADGVSLDTAGRIEIVETKKTLEEVTKDPVYENKLRLVERGCDNAGFKFRILDLKDINREPRLSNARAIGLDRNSSVTSSDKMRIVDAIENNGGTITYGEAAVALSHSGQPYDPAARARLHALIVRRFVSVDIEKRIDLFTPLELCEPTDESLADVFGHLRTH